MALDTRGRNFLKRGELDKTVGQSRAGRWSGQGQSLKMACHANPKNLISQYQDGAERRQGVR